MLGIALFVAGVILWLSLRPEAATDAATDSGIPPPSTEDVFPRSFMADTITATAVAQLPPSLDGFSVSVQLQTESTDALVLARVREYYEALISGLRAVPGLNLVEGEPDFRVTISSPDEPTEKVLRSSHAEWVANVSAEVLTGEAAGTVYGVGMIGDAWRGGARSGVFTRGPLSGECGARTLVPCTPADIAERQVMALRKHVFPRDGTLEKELEAQFLDAARSGPERQRLRNELKSMNIVLSDAMVREALARLARPLDTSDLHAQAERQDLLIILAGQRHKASVQPLIDFALHDPDVPSRIEAVKLLATDFPENSAVRTAVEKLALDPSHPELQRTAASMLSRMSGN